MSLLITQKQKWSYRIMVGIQLCIKIFSSYICSLRATTSASSSSATTSSTSTSSTTATTLLSPSKKENYIVCTKPKDLKIV